MRLIVAILLFTLVSSPTTSLGNDNCLPTDVSAREIDNALKSLDRDFRLVALDVPGTYKIHLQEEIEVDPSSSILIALDQVRAPNRLVDEYQTAPVFKVTGIDADSGVTEIKVSECCDKIVSGTNFTDYEAEGKLCFVPYDSDGQLRGPASIQDPYFTSRLKTIDKTNHDRKRLSLPEDNSHRNLSGEISKSFKLRQQEPDTSFNFPNFIAKHSGREEAQISFFSINISNGTPTPVSSLQLAELLEKHYPGASVSRLGSGGLNIVYKVCPPGKKCISGKISKADISQNPNVPPTYFIHDVALAFIAKKYFQSAKWLNESGTAPKPFVVNGVVKKPPEWKGGFAQVLTPNPKMIVHGIWETQLLKWDIPDDFLKEFYEEIKSSGINKFNELTFSNNKELILKKHKSWTPEAEEELKQISFESEKLIDILSQKDELNFEISGIADIVRTCEKLKDYSPAVQRLCFDYREQFFIPDDFLDRVHALEHMYRVSSKKINNWQLGSFGTAPVKANTGDTRGHVHIIGFDYNRGDNVAWNPIIGEFGVFDL